MISVTFTVDAFDRITAVTLRGHAQSVKQGIDPLCAAVTGIMTYTVNTLKEVKRLSPYVSAKDPGDLTIRIEEAQAEAAQDLLQGLRVQFQDYEKQYPDSIRVAVSQ